MANLTSLATLRRRLNVSRLALSYPRATICAWLLVAAGGVLAASRLPVAMFPDIVFPVIVVVADAPMLPSEAIERDLALPIEARVLPIRDRGSISTQTGPGRATVTVPFDVGVSLETAERRVRAAIAGLQVPGGARIAAHGLDLNEAPVATYAIAPRAGHAPAGISPMLERLAARLAETEGVARVISLGGPAQPGEPPTQVRLDGEPAFALEVIKHAGANTLDITRTLDRIISDAEAVWPLRIVAVGAEGPYIREATGATLEALWAAVALSIVVIYAFLRSVPATAISALAIPTSLVGTFLVMALAGFKFETITLLALALVIGIIVDDAIVDVENIARHLPNAANAHDAALRATDEIGLTVTAATLTIAAVFVPVGLMGGVVGTFFRPFGLTISAAVLTSLAVARTLAPVLAARWLKVRHARPPSRHWRRFSDGYRRLLGAALRRPAVVLGTALASLAGGIAIVPLIPQGFIPALDRGECIVRFSLPAGSDLAATDAEAARLSARIGADRDVATVMSVAGGASGESDRGLLHVVLRRDRSTGTLAIEQRLRRSLALSRGVQVSVENVPIIAVAAPQPLEITLTSDASAALPSVARRVLGEIQSWPGVADAAIGGAGPDGDGTWLRRDGRPAVVIRGNLTGSVALGTISERVTMQVPRLLTPGVHLSLAGESAQAAEVFGHFAAALGLALVGVLLVLLLLFRNWQDPVTIATSLPLSAVGAMLGLFVARSDFGIVSLLGLVFLAGLVNKNAIILVDRINQLRAAGLDRDAAILEAGPVRLRPIVMTTAAAVLGMVPIALGLGAGAELRAPMAVAIIGGLLASTLLSLVVVPVVYQLLDRWRPRFREERLPSGPAR